MKYKIVKFLKISILIIVILLIPKLISEGIRIVNLITRLIHFGKSLNLRMI